jgi:serine/threonine-protein kinase RsbT
MELLKQECFPIKNQNDIALARKVVRLWATEATFSLLDQTKVITAASELARNTLVYGGGGEMKIALLKNDVLRSGLRLVFEDQGPGIVNVELALTDGFSTVGSLGKGLPGTKRLMSEFNLETGMGKGTCVTVIKWK